jgi:Spy/CpxP family protein refolding chaperone
MILIFAGVLLSPILAHAQERGTPTENTPPGNNLLRLLELLPRSQGKQTAPTAFGQRGARSDNADVNADILNHIISTDKTVLTGPNGTRVAVTGFAGAWWANNGTATRLGLTDDQKLKLEQAFERNRQSLTASKTALEKEEAQLATLLDSDQVDRGSVASQIYKVIQARGEMERINSLMTLEMREVLTRAQWIQLQERGAKKGPVYLTVPSTRGGGRGQQ